MNGNVGFPWHSGLKQHRVVPAVSGSLWLAGCTTLFTYKVIRTQKKDELGLV